MTESPEIRQHANGSIDLAHYAHIGRALHGHAVRLAARRGVSALARLIAWPAAAIGRHKIQGAANNAMLVAPAE